jgi:DNA-3-methyladenine glycosylase II
MRWGVINLNAMRKAMLHLKLSDPVMRGIIERVGPCRIQYGPAQFSSLAESIVYQQLNGRAAATIFERVLALTGRPLTPAGVLKLTDEQLRGAGLSKQKLSYLKDLAAKTNSGELDFARLPQLADEEVIAHLTQIKGIGVWTAQMFLMFTLRRPDVLPTGDYGIQNAIRKHYGKRKMPKPKEMERLARPWAPHRTLACWYLWKSLDVKDPVDASPKSGKKSKPKKAVPKKRRFDK